jgi:hypothetical protein
MAQAFKDEGLAEGLAKGMDKGLAEGLAKGMDKGLAEGLAKAVLRLLAARGVPVDDASRQRILGCGDVGTLERWFDRAVTATRLSDILESTAQ